MKFTKVEATGSAIVLQDINHSTVTINTSNKEELSNFFDRFKDNLDEIYELIIGYKSSHENVINDTFVILLKKRKLESESKKLSAILNLFDRAVFDVPLWSEEPSAMFEAIQETRISLQKNGASLLPNQNIADRFKNIRQILLQCETSIQKTYPIVEQLAAQLKGMPFDYNRRKLTQEKIPMEIYYDPVREMMDVRSKIEQELDEIKAYYQQINTQIRELEETL